MTGPVAVLVADDRPGAQSRIAHLLASRPGVTPAGEATSGLEAVRLAEERQPDVVVIDIRLAGGDGLDAVGRIARAMPHIGVVVEAPFEDDDVLFAALRFGALGYSLDDGGDDALVRAVLSVAAGEPVVGPAVASRLLEYFDREPLARTSDLYPRLTAAERDLLGLLAGGLDARRLGLPDAVVRHRLADVFAKLHLADRARAIVAAHDAGSHPRGSIEAM
ncbi:MAG TPA: response regulator transcription factor [Acidimicrobiales bacterium]|nr:response regulator transcription factor [Acidimicrobiales bacterium]